MVTEVARKHDCHGRKAADGDGDAEAHHTGSSRVSETAL